jgi:hypothetical protein
VVAECHELKTFHSEALVGFRQEFTISVVTGEIYKSVLVFEEEPQYLVLVPSRRNSVYDEKHLK